jgi:hypothetical protein
MAATILQQKQQFSKQQQHFCRKQKQQKIVLVTDTRNKF